MAESVSDLERMKKDFPKGEGLNSEKIINLNKTLAESLELGYMIKEEIVSQNSRRQRVENTLLNGGKTQQQDIEEEQEKEDPPKFCGLCQLKRKFKRNKKPENENEKCDNNIKRMTATASTEDEAFDELAAKTGALMKVATDIRAELDKK